MLYRIASGLLVVLGLTITLNACGGGASFTNRRAMLNAVVTDKDGNGIGNATLREVGGSASATTSAQGRAAIDLPVGNSVVLKITAAGWAEQFKALSLPLDTDDAYLEIQLIDREPAQTLVNAELGGTVDGKNGTRITLPANALVTATGQPVTGNVQIALSPVNIQNEEIGAFPGRFAGIAQLGAEVNLVSYGVAEFLLTQGAQVLQLAPGKSALIEIPIYATVNPGGGSVTASQTIPVWSLNETTALWTEEVLGTVVASTSDSGFAVRATISHLSWWNVDLADVVSGFIRPSCRGVSGSFSIASACSVTVGSGGGGTPQSLAGGTIPAAGSSESLPIPPDQNVRIRGCALVQTTDNRQGTACGSSVVNVPVGTPQSVDIQLSIENDWSGSISGDFFGPLIATLEIVGSSISGTATGLGATWTVDGTVNANDTITFGLADGTTNTVDFAGSLNALRTNTSGTWEVTAGNNQGATGTFTLAVTN